MRNFIRALSFIIFLLSVQCDANGQSRFWGTTVNGFDVGFGGIFSIGAEGEDFKVQHVFGENPGHSPNYAELIRASNGKFYGTATNGGFDDNGVLFQFDTAANKYKALVVFDRKNGSQPYGGVIQAADGKLYGMTQQGGMHDKGVLYSYDIDSSKFRVLHHFKDTLTGNNPFGDLLEVRSGILYGMNSGGGRYNRGVIFSYNTAKDTLIKHFDFNDTLGARPRGSLTLVGGLLYGVTHEGGTNTGKGAIFSIDTATNVVTLHYSFGSQTGESPMGRMIMAGNGKLYGVAVGGGLTPGNMSGTSGTVFAIDTSNYSFSVIRQFSGVASLANPVGSLVKLNNGKLYGTCSYHINSPNKGGVYSIVPNSTYTVERSFSNNDEVSNVSSPLTPLANGKLIGLANRGGTHINRGTIYMFDTTSKVPTTLLEFGTSLNGNVANGSLIMAANGKIYGTTREGGTQRRGVLFSIDPLSSEQKVLHNFVTNNSAPYTPDTKLFQAPDGKLYGVTGRGGNSDYGTIFSFDTVTNTLTRLYSFSGSTNGAYPKGNLLMDSSGMLFGTTNGGGSNNRGIFYRFNPSGNNFSKLADFIDTAGGHNPNGQLIWDATGNIMGMCMQGGTYGQGTVFRFNLKDTTLVNLVNLLDTLSGGIPKGGMLKATNGLYYGMTEYGGTHNMGVIFSYNDSSKTAKIQFHFKDTATGVFPQGNLIQSVNGWLYGMTNRGGSGNLGAAFRFDIDSGRFEKLYNFSGTDGAYPAFNEMLEVFMAPNTWTGIEDTLWTKAANWSYKRVPSGIETALIPASVPRYPLINVPVNVNRVIIDSGATISIGKQASLTIARSLENNGTLFVQDEGHLLPGEFYTQTGKGIFRVNRMNYTVDTASFGLWSSPVEVATATFLPGPESAKKQFPAGGASFTDFYGISNSDTLLTSKGYSTGADSVKLFEFSGWAHNGYYEMQVKSDSQNQVFNLLGNPYPSAINAGQLMDLNDGILDRVIYIKMPPAFDTKYSADGMVAINDQGASGIGLNKTNITLNMAEIGVARGFFTIALQDDTIKFDNSLRNGNLATLNSIFDPLKIWLTLQAPDSFYSQTLCAFSPTADTGYDIGQDAIRFSPNNGLSLYSLLQSDKMAIQALPQIDSIGQMKLGLKSKIQGEHKLFMNNAEQADYYHLFLDDLDSNKSYNLKLDTAALNLSANTEFNQRFRLRIVKILPEITVKLNGVCLGDTAVFEVNNPVQGFRYQWELAGNANAGDTLLIFKTTAPGKLILRQFDKDGNSADSREVTVIIHPLPAKPALQRTETNIFAGNIYKKYEWFRNNIKVQDSTRASLVINRSGNYFCIVSDSNQCSIFSDTLNMPKVEINERINHVCAGDTNVFEVKNVESGFRYQWLRNGQAASADTGISLLVTVSEAISLVQWHVSGYRDTSITIQSVVNPLPLKPTLKYTPGILDADTGYTAYQWFSDGVVLQNARAQVYIFRQKGNYFCEVKNTFGCRINSDTVEIEGVEINTVLNNPCLGDTAVFEVKLPKTGFRYRWLKDGVSLPQDTNTTFRVTSAANIVLIESNSLGYRDTSASVLATFRPLPAAPVITLFNAELEAGNNYDGYQWTLNGVNISGANASVHGITQTGLYNCIVENQAGCFAIGSGYLVTGTAVKSIANNVCAGDSAFFGIDDPKDGFEYRWYINGQSASGDTGLLFKTISVGSLYIVESNRFGYSDTSAPIQVQFRPLPAVPNIVITNGGLNAGGGYSSYQWLRNNVWLNGATDSLFQLTRPGNYTCRVTNAQGCRNEGASPEIKIIGISELKNNVCEDDSTTFYFTHAKPGFSYQWHLNGVATGNTDTIFFTPNNGLVTLLETNAFGYSETSNGITSILYPYPNAPALAFINGLLDAGSGFDAYEWYKDGNATGIFARYLAPGGPGSYAARVGNKGCFTTGNPWIFNKIEITTLKNNVCEDEEAQFEVREFFSDFQYQWMLNHQAISGETGNDISLSASGNLEVVQWNAAGYRDTSAIISVVVNPLPLKPTILKDEMKLMVSNQFDAYQWYRNGVPISGANAFEHEVTMNGDYHCRVQNLFNCYNYSDTTVFSSVWINPKETKYSIKLYPNPTLNNITIVTGFSDAYTLKISDISGKIILEYAGQGNQPEEIDTAHLMPGSYFVIIEVSGHRQYLKFVKN